MAGPYKLDNQYADFSGTNFFAGDSIGHWQAETVAVVGDRIIAKSDNVSDDRFYVFECTAIAGDETTGAAEPNWAGSGVDATVDDDTNVTWTKREPTVWTNAHGRLDWLVLHLAAGETIHVDDSHNETHNVNADYNITSPGTIDNPIKIINVDKADDSTSIATRGRVFDDHGSSSIQLFGYFYIYGIEFESDEHIRFVSTGGGAVVLEDCYLELNTVTRIIESVNNSTIANSGRVILLNCILDFANSNNYFNVRYNSSLYWSGGSLVAPNGVAYLLRSNSYVGTAIIQDVDLSAAGDGGNARALALISDPAYIDFLFSRCKLPNTAVDTAFTITSGAWARRLSRVRAYHCSSAANTYEYYESCYEGTIEDETTVVRDGGASDGTTQHSMKMVSSANTIEYIQPLVSRPIHGWNATTGSPVTFTIYFTKPDTEGVDYDDDKVWAELELPANDGGLGKIVFDRAGCTGTYAVRDPQATPAAQEDDASDWGGVDHDDNPQKLSVTVTPALAGQITARVMLALPSKTIYVDPVIYMN